MKKKYVFLPILVGFSVTLQAAEVVRFSTDQISAPLSGTTQFNNDLALDPLNPTATSALADYSGPDIYQGHNRIAGGNDGVSLVSDFGGSGARIRLNDDNKNIEADALYMFGAGAADLTGDGFLSVDLTINLDAVSDATQSDMLRVESAAARWVLEDAGSFYISNEFSFDLIDARDNLNITQVFTNNVFSLSWSNYNPTVDGDSITTSIGSTVSTPAFTDVDLAGIYLSLDGKDTGNAKTNFGITEFIVGVPEPSNLSLIASVLIAFSVLGYRRRP